MSRLTKVLLGILVLSSWAGPALGQSISFISEPSTIGSGLQSPSARARLSDSQHGGVSVTITVADSLLARVAPDGDTPGSPSIDVFLPNGSIDAFFVVQALEGATGSVQVDVTAPGFTGASFTVDLVTPYYEISGLQSTVDVPDADDAFTVRVGVASSPSASLIAQQTRAGGSGLNVEIAVDDPVVGELVTEFNRGSLVNVFLPPGESSTPFTVAQGGVALDGLTVGSVTVSVQIAGLLAQDDATQSVTVEPAAIGWIGVPTNVGSGLRTGLLRARLNGPAHGGVTVQLESLDPSRLLLATDLADTGVTTRQVFVPDGQIDALFYADGLESTTGLVVIEATAPGWLTASSTVDVQTPFIDLSGVNGSQDTLDPPDAFVARVGLSSNGTSLTSVQDLRIGSPGVEISFTVDDSTLALLETSQARDDTVKLDLSEGQDSTPFTVDLGGVEIDGIAAGQVIVSASAPGFQKSGNAVRTVSITQPQVGFIGMPATVGSGHVSSLLRARLGATQHGGTTVRVESEDSTKVLLSTDPGILGGGSVEVFVPDGAIDAFFYAQALEAVADTVQVTATALQFQSMSSDVRVLTPALQVAGLPNSLDTADPVDPFYARLGAPISNGSTVLAQDLRPGSPGVTVEFTLSDSTAAQLVTQTSTAGSQSIPVGAGQNTTPFNLNDGGVGLDGLSPATITVSARAAGYTPIAASDDIVDIVSPTISLLGTTSDLGAGLQSAIIRARLSAAQHGGVTVRVESGDSTVVFVTPDENQPGTGSAEIFVPNGSIDAIFRLQALEGFVGTVTVTATAPGFVPAVDAVDVVTPAVDVTSLGSTLSVGAAPDAFWSRVGPPNSNATALATTQEVRPGGPPLEILVSSDDPAVAELVTLAGSGPSATLTIFPGQSNSPTSIAAGGVGARGLAGGSAVIDATVPGFVVVGSGQREVTVASNGIGLAGVPAFLGSRLQTPLLFAQLENPAHGGVTLTIASEDTTRALVAPDPLSPGAPSLDVFLPNNVGSTSFVIQGREGGTGSVTVSAVAGGAAGSVVFEVVEPALQIVGLPDSLEVVDPDAVFTVQTGVASASGDSLAQRQAVRTGAGPLQVSVVNALKPSGELVTSLLQADSLVVEVLEAEFQSPGTVNGGGVAFTPTQAGTTTLTASATDFLSTTRAAATLVVFGDLTAAPGLPRQVALEPNVPNPFNPSTTIRFTLPQAGRAEVTVLDLRGRRVRTLVDGDLEAGVHTRQWTGLDDRGHRVASGVYFLRLSTQGEQRQQKMVLVK